MRALIRAAAVSVFGFLSLVGPVSAATSPQVIAQQPPAAGQATITGKITDSRGNGLAGATVTASGPENKTTTSLSDGSYSFTLPPGVYTVFASHGGFQGSQSDPIAIVAGTTTTANATLVESNLQSLRIIGRSSTSGTGRSTFNVSEAAVSTLPSVQITIRQNPNLTDIVATLPGVVAQRTFSATPNTNFDIRGAALQTRVTIDGHPISSGIAGQWNTNYANSLIFQDVEVVKGPGLNGSIAGESAVGTVNLRTRDFTVNNSAGLMYGQDSYQGGIYNVYADVNFLPGNRASLIVQKAYTSLNGPWGFTDQIRAGNTNVNLKPIATGMAPNLLGLAQWTGDFSNAYSLEAELAKLRYRLSETTSVTFEYLGLQGQYQPQGGSYASYLGPTTLQACQNGTAFQPTLATCVANSTYTAPYTFKNIGQQFNAYTWFPNSFIQNNEPQFAAELRTSLGNDTVLFRPYTHLINRFISGQDENHYPGNGGGWYAVTNVANCQPLYAGAASATVGAKGPCFTTASGPNGAAYVGAGGYDVNFKTTPTAPSCSPTPPYTCFTTPTAFQNDGQVGFSTPFSQPELDRLNGYTFSYIHPVGDNIINFSYDYRKDFAQSQSGDTTPPAPGCHYVIGSVTGAAAATYQPGCYIANVPGYTSLQKLPRSAIGTPPTVSQYADLALTGSFQLTEKLRMVLGNYFEIYKLNAQIENPATLTEYATMGNASAAPVDLVTRTQTYNHYDPHGGFEFRATRDLSFRLTAGSSITQPYPALVSGFGSVTIPNVANGGNYTDSIPNFDLKPETTVVYDAGFDARTHDGGTVSMDIYDQTVHNVFLSNTSNIGSIAGTCGPGQNLAFPNAQCLQTNYVNGSLQRGYGVEVQATKIPVRGFGYYLSGTLSRTYLDQLPLSIYFSNTSPTKGNFNIDGEQLFGFPFFKAYASFLYADVRGDLYEFGADHEGPNNFTFYMPYTIYDAGVRIPIVPRLRLGISAQNLFDLNTGTALGRALSNQGYAQPTVWKTPTGQIKPGNSFTYTGTGYSQINALPPQNFRVTFDYSL